MRIFDKKIVENNFIVYFILIQLFEIVLFVVVLLNFTSYNDNNSQNKTKIFNKLNAKINNKQQTTN